MDQDRGDGLLALVTMGELEAIIKWFKRDKSLGPDGWSIEFYIAFFDILEHELLQIIEECRTSGRMYDAFTSTFIALIPNIDDPQTFDDYRPISLCNRIYKIIPNRFKPILYYHISSEQFVVLDHRHIHEDVGTVQEALHSIKSKKCKGIILKIDLAKAFDRTN